MTLLYTELFVLQMTMLVCNLMQLLLYIQIPNFKISTSASVAQCYYSVGGVTLEYASSAWDPFLKKDIDLIENVQKFALKVCTKSWDASYSSLLEVTRLPSLQTRRTHAKLCNLFKIINGLTFYPDPPSYTGQAPTLPQQNCAQ